MTTKQPYQTIGWGKFIVQVLCVAIAYIAGSTVPVLVLGQTSAAMALSSFCGMLGGVLAAWLVLRKQGLFREALGLLPVSNWRETLGWAALSTGAIIAIFIGGGALLKAIGIAPPAVSGVMGFASQSPQLFALWIVAVAWAGAGFGEEVLWRGFLMDRLSRLPVIGSSTALVVIIQAVIFSLPHLYQGLGGMLITGAVGLLLGWLRLRSGGVIWACVIAHASVDTIMLSLGYAEAMGVIGGG